MSSTFLTWHFPVVCSPQPHSVVCSLQPYSVVCSLQPHSCLFTYLHVLSVHLPTLCCLFTSGMQCCLSWTASFPRVTESLSFRPGVTYTVNKLTCQLTACGVVVVFCVFCFCFVSLFVCLFLFVFVFSPGVTNAIDRAWVRHFRHPFHWSTVLASSENHGPI